MKPPECQREPANSQTGLHFPEKRVQNELATHHVKGETKSTMVDLAIIAGTLVGSMSDPVFLFFIIIAAGLALTPWRARFYVLAGLAVLAGSIRVTISGNNRAALGLPESPYTVHIFVATVVGILLAFMVVATVRYLTSDAGRPPHVR